MEKLLRDRKRQGNPRDQETKWATIFRLLFPNVHELPSPGRSKLALAITHNPSDNLVDYEHGQKHAQGELQESELREIRDYFCKEASPSLREELKAVVAAELDFAEDRMQEHIIEVFQRHFAPKLLDRYCKLKEEKTQQSAGSLQHSTTTREGDGNTAAGEADGSKPVIGDACVADLFEEFDLSFLAPEMPTISFNLEDSCWGNIEKGPGNELGGSDGN